MTYARPRPLAFLLAMSACATPAVAKPPAPYVVPAGETFDCTPIAVWDGDGPIHCEEGPRIRLQGINAREMDEPSCRPGFPCVHMSGIDARDALVQLVGTPVGTSPHGHVRVKGPTMTCLSFGSARGNRTGAFCTSPVHGDLSCAMVKGGAAAKWDRYWGDHRCEP